MRAMMILNELKQKWNKKYQCVPMQFKKLKTIPAAASGFNTNIDAVLKVDGKTLEKLITQYHISTAELNDIRLSGFRRPEDVILGIVKCFSKGIAEEWVSDDVGLYQWLSQNLGYHHLQMGGQGGIIANVLALLGVQKVIAHTNSHPAMQAQQFLDLDNLQALDEHGALKKAVEIARAGDTPLIHWIIEFDKGDRFTAERQEFVCPKSNRFIATYDPMNMNLVIDENFISYLNNHKVAYLLLSGFHPLLSSNNGIEHIKKAVPIIKQWQQHNPEMIMHLEIASTQDKAIRQAIVEHIAPLMTSAGLNERETIDLLEICGKADLAALIEKETTACHLFDAILYLKQKLGVARLQLHMFGLYLTIQDERYPFSAQKNLKGMMTAAVVSSSKALNGALQKYDDLMITQGNGVSDVGLKELSALAEKLNKPELLQDGVCKLGDVYVSAVPTILVDKPKTLVGMGDTISSVSLLAGC